ncbi:armadillo repeat-containing protein 5 [Carcharodon carcharias]|uniref:armadillo repeat-containing protein 5 n=1 Tax=Carcharodon carcharias TaxID=13397 RepID=UPI001B7EA6E8|nr:armadillo repeat-containing protein 5 [Carcharodon carcharias]
MAALPPPPALRDMEVAASLRQCAAQLGPQTDPGRRLQALLALRTKHLKEAGAAERFRRAGGVRALVGLLLRDGARPGKKELEIGLSILANCCTQEGARREIRKLGGIPPLVNILKGFSLLSVQNRAARALGNLALESENSVIIHQSGAVPHLIGLLSATEDADCLQTAVRTLRILSDTPAHRRSLTAQGCVAPLLGLLGREEPGLLGAAARAAAELTRSCGAPCALQVSRHGGVPLLAGLAARGGRGVREGALAALGNLCGQGFLRPGVGGAGGVGLLVGALRSDPGAPSAPAHLRALCLCCREAVNRARVREEGGLDLLLALLKEPGHRASRPRILAALLGFFYDQPAMDYLHARGLVPVLLDELLSLAGLRPPAGLPPHPCPEEPEDERQAASFDYPPDRPIAGEEQPAEASSSFLSLRSWLVSEGYIESPDEVLPGPPGETEITPQPLLSPGERAEREGLDGGPAERPGEASPGAAYRPLLALPLSPAESPATPSSPSSSSPPPPPPPPPPPTPPEPCLPEAPVLLLLSRFSQAEDPAPGLVTEGSLRAFLDYLTLARPPGARCARLLARLACNPNCLEALVRGRAVPLVRAQLIHGLRPGAPLEGTEIAGRERGEQWTFVRRNRELGEVLLRNLSVQAESPFGAGTLTHMLLSSSQSEREACAIALPLLCR